MSLYAAKHAGRNRVEAVIGHSLEKPSIDMPEDAGGDDWILEALR